MPRRKPKSRKRPAATPKGKRGGRVGSRHRAKKGRQSRANSPRPTASQQKAKVRGFAAINRVKRGLSKTLSAAARAEGTTRRTIERLLPAAVYRDARGQLRVKAGDPYSWPVEIVTDLGAVVVKARGSRERDRAGRHRSVWLGVLQGKLPASAWEEFRSQKVGGLELLSNPERLITLAEGRELDQLDSLYVVPETHA